MTDPLRKIGRAAASRRRAELAYVDAIAEAVAAGVSFADVARAAGITRQAAWQMLARRRR